MAAFLNDINTFLHKASSLGVSGTSAASGLSAATRAEIASEIKNPTFDVWTGKDDKTVRKLTSRRDRSRHRRDLDGARAACARPTSG